MSWARIDDTFHDHPKVMGLDLAAVGLWTLALSWTNGHQNGGLPGHISEGLLVRLAGRKGAKLAVLLENAGLWEACPDVGGWIIHDFEDYLAPVKSPEEADAIREARSEAGRRGAAARWKGHGKHGKPDSNLPSESWQTDGKPMAKNAPVPVPITTSDSPSGESRAGSLRDPPAAPPRPDVDRICDHLADAIEANGSKRPMIGKAWRNAARLLLDRDKRTEDEIVAAIDWCQRDDFWRSNILSMPTLRAKYDRLRLQAQRTSAPATDRQAAILRAEMAWARDHDANQTAIGGSP